MGFERDKIIDLGKLKRSSVTRKNKVYKIDHMDWEYAYQKDAENGEVIDIHNSTTIGSNDMSIEDNSIFDPRFNAPTNIDKSVVEYTCKCGNLNLKGKFYEGRVCEVCGEEVKASYSSELLKRGWIDLQGLYILNPSIYVKLKAYIGNKLDDIINYTFKVDEFGHTVTKDRDLKNPYANIGLMGLKNNYEEVLTFFKRYSNKPHLYDVLMERKDIAFTSKVYVMNIMHRPGFVSKKKKSVSIHTINTLLIKMVTDINIVKKGEIVGENTNKILYNIQHYLNEIYNLVDGRLSGKGKLIRENVIAGRMWYSTRLVIVAETENDDIDTCRLSYKAFLNMYELEIINCMIHGIGTSKYINMTIGEIKTELSNIKYSDEVDEDIWAIINMLIHHRKDDGIYILINRNPSFDIGSIQTFRIADVIKDATNNYLTIQHNSLGGFNGDYDGDVLNGFALKEAKIRDAFKAFLPSRLILDRTGGYYNRNAAPVKDEMAFIKCLVDEDYKPVDSDDPKNKLRSIDEIRATMDKSKVFNYDKEKLMKLISIINDELNDIATWETIDDDLLEWFDMMGGEFSDVDDSQWVEDHRMNEEKDYTEIDFDDKLDSFIQ